MLIPIANHIHRSRRQSGMTMIEVAVVMLILGILAFGAFRLFKSGTKSARAQALTMTFDQVGGALERFQAQTGCYPNRLDVLWDRALAVAANNFCGLDLRPNWNEPFMKEQPMTAANDMMLDSVQSGATLQVTRAAGGIGTMWLLTAANIPNNIALLAVNACNSTDPTTAIPAAWAANLKCTGVANGAELTNVVYRFSSNL